MKVVITGGSGYLAGRIAAEFIKVGHEVKLASRSFVGATSPLLQSAMQKQIEWDDTPVVLDLVAGQDVVIHAAGLDSVSSEKDPTLAFAVNAAFPERLAMLSKEVGVKVFVYLSTIHVYSEELNGEYNESSILHNSHPYASSHAEGERLVSNLASDSFQVINLRLANVFGAPVSSFGNSEKLVAHDFVIQAVRTGKIVVSAPPATQRNFVPASYLCELLATLLTKPKLKEQSQTINVSADRNMTLYDLATEVSSRTQKAQGDGPIPIVALAGSSSSTSFKVSNTLASQILKYDQKYFFSELDSLIDYAAMEEKSRG